MASQLHMPQDTSGTDIPGGTPRPRSICNGCGKSFISLNGHLARAPTCMNVINQVTNPRQDTPDDNNTSLDNSPTLSKLGEVFGAPYLNRRGEETGIWYKRWRDITMLSGKQYDLPNGAMACRFIDLLASELDALVEGTYPSERVFVYVAVTLQWDRLVKQAKDIRKLLERRLNLWEQGHFDVLTHEALSLDKKLVNHRQPNKEHQMSFDHVIKIFHRLMLRGKIREAVRWLEEEGRSSTVLAPESLIDGQRRTVLDELRQKHPEPVIPNPLLLETPDGEDIPPLLGVHITEEHVESTARKLHGGGGPSGSSAEQWADFLLRYGRHSQKLRGSVAALANLMANQNVPWESIKALVAGRLVALDKNPGVRPIGVGECLRRILGKVMALATGEDVTAACKEKQLCGGLAAGIEGAVHTMDSIFFEHTTDSDWGLLLVDAKNAFNAMNRALALWQARVLWPRCAKFLYNMYRGHAELVFRGSEEKLYSMEGVTQGDPLAMLLYGLSTLPLINQLQGLRVTQCWYADDSSAQGQLTDLKIWWEKIQQLGPDYGYFPEGKKSYLVVHPDNVETASSIFSGTGIKVVTGQRFLGGYVGDEGLKQSFLDSKVEKWVQLVEKLSQAGSSQPQSAYAAFVKSTQFRWQFVQRIAQGNENTYTALRNAIRSSFIPALMKGEVTPEECDLFSLPVKKGGLALSDPVATAHPFYTTSRSGTSVLAHSIQIDGPDLVIGHHLSALKAEKKSAMQMKDEETEAMLQQCLTYFPASRRRAIERAVQSTSHSKSTGWLSVAPIKKQHFDMSPTQFRDALTLRYMRPPADIPPNCDGCGARFSIEHALNCKTGGLVTRRHNEVRDVLGQLMEKAWGNCIKEPLIQEASEIHPALRGDLACRGVWEVQREALFDIRVTDTDAPSYLSRTVSAVFKTAEEEKKRKYVSACEARHATFTPLVASVDGHFAPQMSAFVKVLAERLADKWGQPQQITRSWIRTRLAFAILRASSLCIHSSRKRWRCAEDLLGGADGAALRA